MIAARMRLATLFLLACSLAAAQPPAKPPKDKAGCADPKVLTRMPGCAIYTCRSAAYDMADVPVGNRGRDKKTLEGALEVVKYSCPPTTSALEVVRNAEGALQASGYNIVHKDKYYTTRFWVTAQSGPQWVYVYASGREYEVTAVKTKEMEQVMEANAGGWEQQISKTGRVSIYGINFDTGKATIKPDSEKVLTEMVTLLQKQADWHLVIAGHTDNTGTDAVNVPLSRQRAEAVIAWLAAKGVDRSRLVATGLGSKKPLADNGTEEGKAQNRRVDLVKLY
jgi:outer membrane protein OmpA-like peptidoglycan-associated protein